uniref:Uncharacterized protein n=1 Tax=Oryza brachyantha TaxID=4533 RepID=J3NF06_ORYBR
MEIFTQYLLLSYTCILKVIHYCYRYARHQKLPRCQIGLVHPNTIVACSELCTGKKLTPCKICSC